MTTIVASRHGVAGDSLISDGSTKSYARKVYRGPNCVFGYCGTVTDGLRWVNWMKQGAPVGQKPELGDDFEGLVVTPKGIYTIDSQFEPFWLEEKTYAIGSGARTALGVLRTGGSLRQAVRAASRVDLNTGGRVTELPLLR